MSRKTDPILTEHLCPWCHRKLYQCWLVGNMKPPRLAPDLHCAYCDANFPKP